MPKAARRTSGATSATRTEPYTTIKPGDKPSASKVAANKSSSTSMTGSTGKSVAKRAPKMALAEKRASEVNATMPSNTDKPASFLDIKLDGEDEDDVSI
jgi:hypothetical protein